jgi:aryl-alcohol dehydrogenase-like predicted oxidoreductase
MDFSEGLSDTGELTGRGNASRRGAITGAGTFLGGITPVETLQPQYSLIAREVEDELLPFAERHAIGVIAYSPMGSGLLTGRMTRERIDALPADDWRQQDDRFQEPQLSRHLALVDRLRTVADRHDTSPGGRRRLDAAQPGGRRRDRRLPPA